MTRGFIGKVINDREIDRVLVAAAKPIAARLEGSTPRRTGRTAASTDISTGHRNAKHDRRAVRVTQRFGAVPLEWRTRRGYMLRAI